MALFQIYRERIVSFDHHAVDKKYQKCKHERTNTSFEPAVFVLAISNAVELPKRKKAQLVRGSRDGRVRHLARVPRGKTDLKSDLKKNFSVRSSAISGTIGFGFERYHHLSAADSAPRNICLQILLAIPLPFDGCCTSV
jgi:hypothetical protein